MKRVWELINGMNMSKSMKNRLYIGVLMLMNIAIGGGIWLVLGRMFLPGTNWMICFMGYPAILIGFFGGIIYLYNHEFKTSAR